MVENKKDEKLQALVLGLRPALEKISPFLGVKMQKPCFDATSAGFFFFLVMNVFDHLLDFRDGSNLLKSGKGGFPRCKKGGNESVFVKKET